MSKERRWKIYSVTVDIKPGLDRPGMLEEEALEYEKKLRQDGYFGEWWWRWNDETQHHMWDGKPSNGEG